MKLRPLFHTSLGGMAALLASFAHGSTPAERWVVQPTVGLLTPRAAHKVTVISPDAVLVTGGCSGTGCAPVERSAELFYFNKGITQATQPMSVPRVSHVAAPLQNGSVLIAGGWTGEATTSSAEIFDARTRSFLPVTAMTTPRMDATATPLLEGAVLIAGGATATNRPVRQAEIFDHEKGRFVAVGSMHEARVHHAAVRLSDGRVLIIGGQGGRNAAISSAEIYDPAARSFTMTGTMRQPRCKHGAVLLKDGRVMVVGGSSDGNERRRIAQTEIYDPQSGQFIPGPELLNPRYKIIDAATVLPSGEVVVTGDANDVEVWLPGTPGFVRVSGRVDRRLAFSTATLLPDTSVLVIGGYDNDIRPTAQTWVIRHQKTSSNRD
ncbi:MAG: kelch repeat-containing protein [candidate division KSB1 bacterium]|nr:kelch repeat-containing protein [candidate division KSB1 bacterium]MDZ7276164.1 kelch repeat-containing protein [candidate division KSB1 bacterium]MDZ7287056.1 kelch repeat-containing protein [candidate division KSB1 bacterium]MDZ7297019.1 kelch repeat-containing protein [candidate division KSB1 bacterium]MDZ7307525.1 kelch repeat-containing protein [candidate division KSB1 bacterium]